MLILEKEKYSSTNTYLSILTDDHKPIILHFLSKNEDLNEFLVRDALEYQKLNLGITYMLFNKEKKLVSYITLGMGALKIPDKKEFEFKGKMLKDYPKDFPSQFPALLIGKLATDKDEEGMGGASLLLDYAVKTILGLRDKIGCAYLVAHVYPESLDWYKTKGFKTYVTQVANRETIPMYFEL